MSFYQLCNILILGLSTSIKTKIHSFSIQTKLALFIFVRKIVPRKTLICIKIIQGSVSNIITYHPIQEEYCGYLFALNMTSI